MILIVPNYCIAINGVFLTLLIFKIVPGDDTGTREGKADMILNNGFNTSTPKEHKLDNNDTSLLKNAILNAILKNASSPKRHLNATERLKQRPPKIFQRDTLFFRIIFAVRRCNYSVHI